MAIAAVTVPGVNVHQAMLQYPVALTIDGTIHMPGIVNKNPIANCNVTAVPTIDISTTSLVIAEYCADSATANIPIKKRRRSSVVEKFRKVSDSVWVLVLKAVIIEKTIKVITIITTSIVHNLLHFNFDISNFTIITI